MLNYSILFLLLALSFPGLDFEIYGWEKKNFYAEFKNLFRF